MTERMKQFFEAAIRNEEALEKMKSLKELSLAEKREQITALAAEMGVTLTEDDFRQIDGAELTDTELEQATGGSGGGVSIDELLDLLNNAHEIIDEMLLEEPKIFKEFLEL